jgi:hypothetical protein
MEFDSKESVTYNPNRSHCRLHSSMEIDLQWSLWTKNKSARIANVGWEETNTERERQI